MGCKLTPSLQGGQVRVTAERPRRSVALQTNIIHRKERREHREKSLKNDYKATRLEVDLCDLCVLCG
jgi:hypothetical protein